MRRGQVPGQPSGCGYTVMRTNARARGLRAVGPVRLSAVLWTSLVCSLAVLACGREPLDLGPTGTGGGAGGAGTSGSAGTTGSAGQAPAAPLPAPAVHRPTAASCPMLEPVPGTPSVCPFAKPPGSELPASWCNTNTDCTGGQDGRCVGSLLTGQCSCTYDACFADTDCPGGGVCACSDVYSGNACVTGACHVDADCGAGGYCSPEIEHCTGAVLGYFCRTAKDTCTDDKDCGDVNVAHCARDPGTGVWGCQPLDGCPL